MSLLQKLKQPFPYDPAIRNHLWIAGFFALFVFMFLFVFEPFELGAYTKNDLLRIASGYGLITFTCILFFNQLLPFIFPRFFNEASWTTGRQIFLMLLIIFLVGLGNYFISPVLVNSHLNLYYFLWFQAITLAVALLPVSIFFLLKQNHLLKRFSSEAAVIDNKLVEKLKVAETPAVAQPVTLPNKILLTGDNQGEKIELYPDDLFLVTSASNYIKIFHLQKDKLVYSILRSTLKKTTDHILSYPNFFKCHRAFIINLDKVVHVEGNAQGYKVKLEGHDDLIPVSRNLNGEFSDKLLSFRKF